MQTFLRILANLAGALMAPFVGPPTAREQVIEALQTTLDHSHARGGMDAIVLIAEIDEFRLLNARHDGGEVATHFKGSWVDKGFKSSQFDLAKTH